MHEGKSELLRMCCNCKAIEVDDEWINMEDDQELYFSAITENSGDITHGYCPSCFTDYVEDSDLPQETKEKLKEKYRE